MDLLIGADLSGEEKSSVRNIALNTSFSVSCFNMPNEEAADCIKLYYILYKK